MTRKRYTERQVIEALAWQGVFATCWRCGLPFFEQREEPTDLPSVFTATIVMVRKPEREHVQEYALGGSDLPFNARYSCAGCHSIITNGTKATSAGSSKHRIAKVKRLRGETCQGPKKKIPQRKDPWPSRKFEKRNVA
jgi:hypothetical protein